ncbi:cyclase family protein [Desulfosporosinus sp. PR]|uniref:cyclase family protein n=1 Tax=Candidatus Desulfosporosinus nitrosoreducens TaxID=3401928 RepID=UPI0027FB1330|nr:cyclase family protein [Desulfosporosinus sp. PR]MDQ7094380.1 cyclase family protein [Desulfosporosinus sp. PR]
MLIDLTLKIELDINSKSVSDLCHYGTHYDSMYVDYDLKKCVTVGKLVTVEEIRDRQIIPEDFNSIGLNEGDFLIFRTGWLKEKTFGTEEYSKDYPELADSTINYLISKKVGLIGIDTPAIKNARDHIKADIYCGKNNLFIVENLANLELINKEIFKVYCFPLNLQNVTGLPCRVVAEV